jgi:hypothetical protein
MSTESRAIWRRRLGVTCAAFGLLLFAAALLPYLRYAADLSNLHTQERIQHAQALGLLWRTSFFGSAVFGVAVRFGMGSLARNCCQRWSFHLRPHDLGCNVRAVRLLLTALSPMRQPTSADLHRITGCICRSRHTNAPHRERSVSPAGSHAVGRPCYTPGSPCRSHPRQSESEL